MSEAGDAVCGVVNPPLLRSSEIYSFISVDFMFLFFAFSIQYCIHFNWLRISHL